MKRLQSLKFKMNHKRKGDQKAAINVGFFFSQLNVKSRCSGSVSESSSAKCKCVSDTTVQRQGRGEAAFFISMKQHVRVEWKIITCQAL